MRSRRLREVVCIRKGGASSVLALLPLAGPLPIIPHPVSSFSLPRAHSPVLARARRADRAGHCSTANPPASRPGLVPQGCGGRSAASLALLRAPQDEIVEAALPDMLLVAGAIAPEWPLGGLAGWPRLLILLASPANVGALSFAFFAKGRRRKCLTSGFLTLAALGAAQAAEMAHAKLCRQHRRPPLQKTQGWGTLGGNGARKHR